MFNKLVRGLAVASIALSAASAAHAAGVSVTQASSPTYWGSATHADLVLRYDSSATATLTITTISVVDLSGNGIGVQLNTCGVPVKTGDTVTAHQLSPGSICFLRAFPTPSNIIARVVMTDGTNTPSGINQYVRTSLETRDAGDSVLTHVDLR